MRNLLNLIGQTFVISGFVLLLLAVPLYYFYPPLYTEAEDHANNLIFLTSLASLWAYGGMVPLVLASSNNEIKIGDLVKWDKSINPGVNLKENALGIVVDVFEDAPIGWYNEQGERETASRYKVFWQDLQSCGWHWKEDIAPYASSS